LLNHLGLIVGRDVDTANVCDGSAFQALIDSVADELVVFSNAAFEKNGWHPTHLKPCKRGE
jgi:hypothetical protein